MDGFDPPFHDSKSFIQPISKARAKRLAQHAMKKSCEFMACISFGLKAEVLQEQFPTWFSLHGEKIAKLSPKAAGILDTAGSEADVDSEGYNQD